MSDTPCGQCGAHPSVHRVLRSGSHSRGHEYRPMPEYLDVTCGKCGREARLSERHGVICPVCSAGYIQLALVLS